MKLPAVSLGLWHNFGEHASYDTARDMVQGAFDLGITHFDLANNYGPPAGAAEKTMGRVLREELHAYRDELFISTKAGFGLYPGPYGDWGSRKFLTASLDRSLQHMGVDYVDVFYHHRRDPETPLEETMDAMATFVRQGKALYVAISNYYEPADVLEASRLLKERGISCLLNQPRYNLFARDVERLYPTLASEGIGSIPYSPLAQGLLTDRYLQGIPQDSRAADPTSFLRPASVTDEVVAKARALNDIAKERGQTLAQMALAWVLRDAVTCSVIIGASKMSQIEDCVAASHSAPFTQEELARIDDAVTGV